jgi:hypothetical protein
VGGSIAGKERPPIAAKAGRFLQTDPADTGNSLRRHLLVGLGRTEALLSSTAVALGTV